MNHSEIRIMLNRISGFLRNSWKYIRKPFLWLCISFATLLMFASLLAYIFEEDVKTYFLEKINTQLNIRVEIGKMDFSLISHFPQASISLEQVVAHHSSPYKGKGNFIEAEQIDFSFGVFELFSGNYSINRFDIQNGTIQILRNAKGVVNYDLIKSTSNDSNEHVDFKLNAVYVKNVNMYVKDIPADFYSTYSIKKGKFKGDLSNEIFTLNVASDLEINQLISDEITWIQDRDAHIEMGIEINKKTQVYKFIDGGIKLSDLLFNVSGIIQNKDVLGMDLHFGGVDLDIRSFLSLLPKEYSKEINKYKSDGIFYCDATLKGNWSKNEHPYFNAQFKIEDASIRQIEHDIELKKVKLTGRIHNGNKHSLESTVLDLNDVYAELNDGKASGEIHLRNLKNPYIKAHTSASFNLSDIEKFFSLKPVHFVSGNASLNVAIEGELKNNTLISHATSDIIKAEGLLKLNDVEFNIEGDSLAYTGFSGNFDFNNNDVRVDNFKGKAGKTDFLMKGTLGNVFGYLFSKDQAITITSTVQSNLVYLDELFARHASNSNENDYHFRISPRLKLKLNARVNQLQFRKFIARNIIGDFRVENRELIAEKLDLKTMGGNIRLSGSVNGKQEELLILNCSANLKKVDITQVFNECEDFGQDVLKKENIQGKLDADVQLNALVSSGLVIDLDKLYATANIVVNEGALLNFTPLNNLSRFISLEELRNVRFSTLKNQIEIRNRNVIIPRMDIVSNALNIGVSGTHNFDNVVDYHFELFLSDLLAKKARKSKKENEEFGVIEDDGLGKTRLFISMKGPVNKPIISYDSRGMQQKFREDLKNEKKSMKQIFKEEFGMFKKDTSLIQDKKVPTKNTSTKKKVLIEFDN
jgi:hypothetical protein